MSEIDDIFAAKGKSPKPSVSSSLSPVKSQKNGRKKKRNASPTTKPALAAKSASPAPPGADQKSSAKRPAPVTVVDTSLPSKKVKLDRPKAGEKPRSVKSPRPKSEGSNDDNAKFADSRGSGPRRKTEEGWNIYKEDELGISMQGGDTPLCPFDCDCCF
ncbi:hypothetical protein AX16_009650 [Volvariella volvacea WC 439]|nr:hypothetical protein AX16_009650 [Volvariella volvacea WC 439]